MKLRPSWEAASSSAIQELPNTLWNPKVHYRVNKSPPLQSMPPQLISLRPALISSFHLRLGLPTSLFPSRFPTNFYMNSCSHPCMLHWSLLSSYIQWNEHFDEKTLDTRFKRSIVFNENYLPWQCIIFLTWALAWKHEFSFHVPHLFAIGSCSASL
jgi:hypothetical protein